MLLRMLVTQSKSNKNYHNYNNNKHTLFVFVSCFFFAFGCFVFAFFYFLVSINIFFKDVRVYCLELLLSYLCFVKSGSEKWKFLHICLYLHLHTYIHTFVSLLNDDYYNYYDDDEFKVVALFCVVKVHENKKRVCSLVCEWVIGD